MKKFFIIGSVNYANRRLLHEFKLQGHEAEIVAPESLVPFVTDTRNDRVYRTTTNGNEPQRIYKKSVNGIVSRIGNGLTFHAKTIEHMNGSMGIPSTAKATALLTANDKVKTIQVFSQNKIKTPKTFAVKKTANLEFMVEKLGGYPIVGKTVTGSQGKGIFILNEAVSASTTLDAILNLGHEILLQQFIETSQQNEPKHDFRLVVVDGEVVAAIRRNSQNNDFRTNASLKEDCEAYEPSEAMKQLAINAANAVGLNVAGVDIAIEAKTGEMFIYEINGNMNFKSTEKYSKKNVAKAIVDYAVKISLPDTDPKPPSVQNSYMGILSKEIKGIPFLTFPSDTDDDELDDMESRSTFANYKPQDRELSELGSILRQKMKLYH